jgi:predicted negative regulator of RcsB-dependent stress response
MNMEPAHHEQPAHGLAEIEKLKLFWDTYGTRITVVAAIVAIAVAGSNWMRSRRAQGVADASAQLSAARTVADLEAIVADYGSTPSAPLAMLQMAKAAYDGGDYNGAMTQYESFRDRYPKHAWVSVAEVGIVQCREARGEMEAAEAAFEEFAVAHPDHFLATQALLGQARCLEQLGRFDDSRVVLENVVATRGDTAWGDHAGQLLETLEDRRETYNNPPVVAAPVMPELIIPEGFAAPVDADKPIMIPATQNAEP